MAEDGVITIEMMYASDGPYFPTTIFGLNQKTVKKFTKKHQEFQLDPSPCSDPKGKEEILSIMVGEMGKKEDLSANPVQRQNVALSRLHKVLGTLTGMGYRVVAPPAWTGPVREFDWPVIRYCLQKL